MQLLTDEEMFGMIPKPDGSYEHGNVSLPILTSLKTAYINALADSDVFPEHLCNSYSYDPDRSGSQQVAKSMGEDRILLPIYKNAFFEADEIIEDHLEKTNGYINRFPPSKLKIYPDAKREFDYFEYQPRDYIPPSEERLNKAYADIHQNCGSAFKGKAIWFVLATLAFALVLLGGQIYSLIPQLGAWASESKVNFYIQIGIILLFLEIIGCFVPGSWWNVDFTNHTLGFLVMLGAIFAWGYMYFPGTTGPAPEEGAVRVIYYLVKWPYIGYFGIIWICYAARTISALTELVQFRKNLKGYKETFARIYEEDINRFHRYVRLRQLWAKSEGIRTPYWVSRLDQRFYQYKTQYEEIR